MLEFGRKMRIESLSTFANNTMRPLLKRHRNHAFAKNPIEKERNPQNEQKIAELRLIGMERNKKNINLAIRD